MKVHELITSLEKFDKNLDVYYCFSIYEDCITLEEDLIKLHNMEEIKLGGNISENGLVIGDCIL